jgi:ketosteroid isomerase-like protein
MPPHAPTNKGQGSIHAWGQRLLQCLKMRVSLSPDDFRASGDLEFESGTYDSMMTVRQTGEVLTDHGKYVVVYRREALDQWSIAREIWNSDKPDLAFRNSSLAA